MQGNGRTRTVVVTESTAQAALRRGPAPALAPDEERVLRMRLGASVPPSSLLERIATASDAEIEVLAYEIEAFLRHKERLASASSPAPRGAVSASPGFSRAKEKIVRALRRK